MTVMVRISLVFTTLTDGRSEVEAFPGIEARLCDGRGELQDPFLEGVERKSGA